MKLSLILALAVLAFGATDAQAKKNRKIASGNDLGVAVHANPEQSRDLFNALNGAQGVQRSENTTGVTQLQLRNIICTLTGSHGDRVPADYSCTIAL